MEMHRKSLKAAIEASGLTMRELSLKLNRNTAYIQQYLTRNSPKELPVDVAMEIGRILQSDCRDFLTEAQRRVVGLAQVPAAEGAPALADHRPEPIAEPAPPPPAIIEEEVTARLPGAGPAIPAAPAESIVEIDARTLRDGDIASAAVVACWPFPEYVISYELRSSAGRLRILLVEDDAAAPDLAVGDRAVIDVTRTVPTPPGVFAVWDGFGVVFRKLENVPGAGIRNVATRAPLVGEAKILGRVVWLCRRL